MFSQRNRTFKDFGHKEIVNKRKIVKMKHKRPLTIFLEFGWFWIFFDQNVTKNGVFPAENRELLVSFIPFCYGLSRTQFGT